MKLSQRYLLFYATIAAYVLTALLIIHVLMTGRVWWWSMMSAIPGWMALFVPIFVLIVFCFSRKNFLLLVCALVASVLAFGQSDINLSALLPRQQVTSEGVITVVSWNSLAWRQGDRQLWLDYVSSFQDADVILLQEMIQPREWDTPDVQEIANRFPGYRLIPHGEWLTITRLPVVGINGNPEQYWLRVDMDIQGKRVSFYNVHIPVHMNPGLLLRNPVRFFEDMKERITLREQQLPLLEQELRSNSYPKVIAGDFNSTRSMGTLGYFLSNFTDVSTLGSDLFPATWGDYGLYLWRIDWAFISREIRALSYQAMPRSALSDHVPLRFQISLPQ